MTTSLIWKTPRTANATTVFCSTSCSSKSGAAASFLLQFKPKRGDLANGKGDWDGMVTMYQNFTGQRRRILKQQLNQMVMTNGQESYIFINEVYYVRDELLGNLFNDDSILDIVLEGLTDEYLQKKYSTEADDEVTLDRAVITMRNMYDNCAMRNGLREKRRSVILLW